MPSRMPDKIKFLADEIEGLTARIGKAGNSVQLAKLEMLRDIQRDYQLSTDRAASQQEGGAA